MNCSRPNCDRGVWRTGTDLCTVHRDVEVRKRGLHRVDAEKSRNHLLKLSELGFGSRQVERLSGIPFRRLEDVRAGRSRRVRQLTEAKILATPLPDDRIGASADTALVPRTGTVRRLQALQALGYTNEVLAAECEVSDWTLGQLLTGDRGLHAKTARKVREVFDRLQMTPPAETYGTQRAKLRAEKRCWVPPLAWDEDAIDDPDAMPDARVNVYASSRRLQSLCRMGFSQKYLAERLDITTAKVSEILRFLGPIDYSLADAIEKLFNELRDTPKNDERLTSRRAAQGRSVCAGYGWAFPDDLGDVFKKPSKQELDSMNRSKNDRADTAKKLLSEGVSKAEIARRMSVNPTTVYFWLREAA